MVLSHDHCARIKRTASRHFHAISVSLRDTVATKNAGSVS